MLTLLIIGDILVCGFMIGIVAYLFVIADDDKQREVSQLPLLTDQETLSYADSGGKPTARPPDNDRAVEKAGK